MILTLQIRVGGILTNATGTPTVVVVRTDTGATIPGTVMVLQSTGVYTCTFSDPAPGLTYFWTVSYFIGVAEYSESATSYANQGYGSLSTGMNLFYARQVARAWMRSNGYDTTLYSDFIIDTAIADCGEQLARETKLLQIISEITIANGISDLPAMPTGFRPERLMSAYLKGDNVQVVPPGFAYAPFFQVGAPTSVYGLLRAQLDLCPFQQLLELEYAYRTPIAQGQSGTITLYNGQPVKLAFSDRTGAGKVFPAANQDFQAALVWNRLFVSSDWILGTQGAWSSTPTYNVGDAVSQGTGSGVIYQALIQNTNTPPTSSTSTWIVVGTGPLSAPTAVSFTLPDDYMRPLLIYGTPSKVQYNEPLGKFALDASIKWLEFIKLMAGAGDLGENYFQRAPIQRGGDGYDNLAGWGGQAGGF